MGVVSLLLRVQGSGFRVQGSGLVRVQVRVQWFRVRVQVRVPGSSDTRFSFVHIFNIRA
jgi:hypothetical protein